MVPTDGCVVQQGVICRVPPSGAMLCMPAINTSVQALSPSATSCTPHLPAPRPVPAFLARGLAGGLAAGLAAGAA